MLTQKTKLEISLNLTQISWICSALPQFFKSIFEKFTEGSHTKQQSGGTGIGLAICRDIIELHNGRIWAKNNKGKGSCFTFVIPRTQPVKQEK